MRATERTGVARSDLRQESGGPDHGTVEVYLHSIDQLFHSMDPSPFQEKSLDANAEEFILNNTRELESRVQPSLVIHLAGSPVSDDWASMIQSAIRRHFARRSQMSKWELRSLLLRGRKSLLIGLTCLAVSVIGSDLVVRVLRPLPLAEVLYHSLIIGGWVAMWGPLEIFLYEWWPIRDQRRLFDRLSNLVVRIVQRDANDAPPRTRATGDVGAE